MDPVQSWLDAKEVRLMAESLMAPPPEVDEAAVDAGYGDDFEGFADSGNAGISDPSQVIQADGRPHAQRQFIHSSSVSKEPQVSAPETAPELPARPSPAVQVAPDRQDAPLTDDSQRIVVGTALADARRVAQESGMLHQEPVETQSFPPQEIIEPVGIEPAEPELQHESPFRVSANQQQNQADPLARQVNPPEHQPEQELRSPNVAQPGPPEVADVWDDEVPAFKPDIEAPSATAAPSVQPPVEPEPDLASGEDQARSPFLSRLQQFSDILRRDLDAQAMFLIDNEGQTLLDEVGNTKLIQVARTLANASYRASRQTAGAAAVGNLHVKIGARATLEVVPVDSCYGLLVLGAIFPAPLGAERVNQVAELLHKTVEPHS